MSRTGVLILLGVLVILVPFSGLPVAVRTLLMVILGACVAGMGFALRAREARHTASSVTGETREASAISPEPPSVGPPEPPQGVSPV